MKIYYNCECCDEPIDMVEVEEIDDELFGFDCLNDDERQDMIRVDELTNSMYVQSLCDNCIEVLGLAEKPATGYGPSILH